MTITFGSVFAGIGGLDLGLESIGMRCVWQIENDPFCQAVLRRKFPAAALSGDVQKIPSSELSPVDCVCGGFPCQDLSWLNTNGKGLKGKRSGLWYELLRIIRDLSPRLAIIENVPALINRGLRDVLGDLASLRFDAEWQVIPARLFGAPHQRDRLFIVAYSAGVRLPADGFFTRLAFEAEAAKRAERSWQRSGVRIVSPNLCDRVRLAPHSRILRMANRLPDRLDRYRGLGNSIMPQIGEFIGRRIVEVLS